MTTESKFEQCKRNLSEDPKKWLVTGAAGFIGSNLVETLLKLGQSVVGLDNYSTGHKSNISDLLKGLSADQKNSFKMVEGDIRDRDICNTLCAEVDYVLHQAALGSVPRSVKDPATSNAVNVDGFINMALAARDGEVKRFVYASSSSVYGDSQASPKREIDLGKPLSPYAVTKTVNELYADVFSDLYGLELIGLRYFNVFGRRQDPNGAYAAVIPRWVSRLVSGKECVVFGDGSTTRDFCYIKNVVQANLLAATVDYSPKILTAYNVSCGEETSLNQLYEIIREGLEKRLKTTLPQTPQYEDFRKGDIKKSLADISAISKDLGYLPQYRIREGMEEALDWYVEHLLP
ncbi:MAG: SDR family oxidoreductase [Bdellovibrionota bacterium]|jgi:UDP-N-acetylglucosamine 4-epimerase